MTMRTCEKRHILYHSQDWYVDLLEHTDPLNGVLEGNILRRGDDDCPYHWVSEIPKPSEFSYRPKRFVVRWSVVYLQSPAASLELGYLALPNPPRVKAVVKLS